MASFLSTLFGGGAETEAAEKNRALAAKYQTQAGDYLKTGYDTGTGYLNKAIGAYDPLSTLAGQYNQAGTTYLGALGVGTPEQIAASRAAFTNAPGYEQGINAGIDVLNRRRATQGMAASGNADIDALTFGQNAQNQQYNTWLQNLQQAGGTGVNLAGAVAGGQAQGYGNLSNLAQLYAQNQTGVAGTGLSANTSANTLQAQGEASGAKNLLGAGLSLATLAAGGNPFGGSLMGGGSALSGGGSMLGDLFKKGGGLFMGGGSPSGYG